MFVGFIVLLRELLVHFVAVKSLINYNNCKVLKIVKKMYYNQYNWVAETKQEIRKNQIR